MVRGKISSLMGDVAKGIKSFKKGMSTDITEDVTDETHISKVTQYSSNEDPSNKDSTNQDSNNKE